MGGEDRQGAFGPPPRHSSSSSGTHPLEFSLSKSSAFHGGWVRLTISDIFFFVAFLGLTDFSIKRKSPRTAFDFWFSKDGGDRRFDECSEVEGGKYLSRVSAYLIDRSTLDEGSAQAHS